MKAIILFVLCVFAGNVVASDHTEVRMRTEAVISATGFEPEVSPEVKSYYERQMLAKIEGKPFNEVSPVQLQANKKFEAAVSLKKAQCDHWYSKLNSECRAISKIVNK